jgi:hypothetical protein
LASFRKTRIRTEWPRLIVEFSAFGVMADDLAHRTFRPVSRWPVGSFVKLANRAMTIGNRLETSFYRELRKVRHAEK